MNTKFTTPFKLTSLALCVLLTACGGGSSSSNETAPTPAPTPTPTPAPTPAQGAVSGPHSTGSVSEPVFVYYDLETKAVIELTTEQAATNTVWDVAFKRSGIFLNQHSDNTVKAYATGNNSDFFDADGKAIAASFIAATAETELDDYLAIKTSDIPTDETKFVADVTSNIIEGFYDYNSTTHVVTAADTKYFIANSDDAFTKFRATSITTAGRGIGQITFQTAYQSSSDAAFSAEQELTIDAALTCSGDVTHVYVDFDINQEVTMADAWDINFPCAADKTGADFTINIADDAQAMHDFDNNYDAIDPTAVAYYGFQRNSYSVKAFDGTPWYQYGVNGGHLLWSQFDVYLIKTPTNTHKLQMTSYYNADGVSGNISFRSDEVNELAGESE
ncbi:HmuY family protein [Cognaticolwellia mytili]|uniref:HmuY family protein n=1 Tax=Cognaticolwellia mytili TaxID=1888913 RepID=UPI000A16D082|nr:HmuY family protein [Cognaticolwellia mytili]